MAIILGFAHKYRQVDARNFGHYEWGRLLSAPGSIPALSCWARLYLIRAAGNFS